MLGNQSYTKGTRRWNQQVHPGKNQTKTLFLQGTPQTNVSDHSLAHVANTQFHNEYRYVLLYWLTALQIHSTCITNQFT